MNNSPKGNENVENLFMSARIYLLLNIFRLSSIPVFCGWLMLLLLGGCQEKKTFTNFDSAAWQRDKLGCNGSRQQLTDSLSMIRLQLRGLTQEEIIGVLGKPDLQLLYERGQKFFVYFMETGSQCDGEITTSRVRTLSVRFSAVNRATEVTIQNGKPV